MKEIPRITGEAAAATEKSLLQFASFHPAVYIMGVVWTVSGVSSGPSLLITNSGERRSRDIKIIWFMETDASSIRADGV